MSGYRSACECVTHDVSSGPAGYGLGCVAHDITGTVLLECSAPSAPAYCARPWCYVLATCALTHSVPAPFSAAPQNYSRSYTSCGQLLPDQAENIINETLYGKPLRALFLNNSAGWTGSYLDASGSSVLNHETGSSGLPPVRDIGAEPWCGECPNHYDCTLLTGGPLCDIRLHCCWG